MKQNKSIYLIPVMLCFFCMGFVDLVGIASNYVKADLGLSDAVAAIGIFFITTLCNIMTFRSMPSVTVFASPSMSVTVACAAIKSECSCPSFSAIADVAKASEASGST